VTSPKDVGSVWLKEPGNAEHRQKIIAAAHSFAREIPEVEFLSVGQTLPKSSQLVDAHFFHSKLVPKEFAS
jgi:hypothetical protein